MEKLLKEIKNCNVCKPYLDPNPVLNFSRASKIMIVGQAPGIKVHKTGIPWNDASGERLREWMGVDKAAFYDTKNFAIVPMGFCYPGKGNSGDLPPRKECSETWMQKILATINPMLTLLIGQYAQEYFLRERQKKTLTLTVKHWKEYYPEFFVLPHPSPRNNIWLKKNPWFEKALPILKHSLQVTLSATLHREGCANSLATAQAGLK